MYIRMQKIVIGDGDCRNYYKFIRLMNSDDK